MMRGTPSQRLPRIPNRPKCVVEVVTRLQDALTTLGLENWKPFSVKKKRGGGGLGLRHQVSPHHRFLNLCTSNLMVVGVLIVIG